MEGVQKTRETMPGWRKLQLDNVTAGRKVCKDVTLFL
jgi:hypothetical protein